MSRNDGNNWSNKYSLDKQDNHQILDKKHANRHLSWTHNNKNEYMTPIWSKKKKNKGGKKKKSKQRRY